MHVQESQNMPLPGNKESTPFKTMDIKTALLASGNRKRKASSPQLCKTEPKALKLSVENSESDNKVKVLEEACGITTAVSECELESNLGDCKENKDINAAKGESLNAECNESKHHSVNEVSSHVNKTSCNGTILTNTVSPKSSQSDSDIDMDPLSEKSKISNSSCDELNALNASLNTSGLSITGGDDEKGNSSSNSNQKQNDAPEKENRKNKMEGRAKKKKMTPAEAQKRAAEREEKQKERLLRKEELESKKRERLLEKEKRLKEKLLRKEREELERKERERLKQEKKEQEEKERLQKQKEKEEKLKTKQMMLELKMEQKKKREEMRLKREEEMKKAEEEKLRAKLEEEQKKREKKERAKAAFVKFFLKGDAHTSAPAPQVAEKEGAFLPFQVSDDMTLAPVIPAAARERFNKKQLDHYLECQDGKELYLQNLKSGSYSDVRLRKKNRKLVDSDADVIVIDKNAQSELGLCPKLLQFCENVRPPYWGTWRKKSKNIRPRNPFGEDDIFDYSIDSDDEWDEGGPGESLSGTEQEDESEDDYEVDNEFFVPHGYLSDEEEKKEDDDEEVNDPEKQKALLKLKLQEFEMERKKKTTELKPIILGCYFVNNQAFNDSGLHGLLEVYCAEFLSESPIPTTFTIRSQQADSCTNTTESPKSAASSTVKKKKTFLVPEEALPDLIRLVHGNIRNKKLLAEEFQKYWLEQFEESQEVKQGTNKSSSSSETDVPKEAVSDLPSDSAQISIRQLNNTIKEIAVYGKCPEANFKGCCWWVKDEVREKYGMMDAPFPNQWKYVSQKEPEPSAKVNCTSIKEFLSSNQEK